MNNNEINSETLSAQTATVSKSKKMSQNQGGPSKNLNEAYIPPQPDIVNANQPLRSQQSQENYGSSSTKGLRRGNTITSDEDGGSNNSNSSDLEASSTSIPPGGGSSGSKKKRGFFSKKKQKSGERQPLLRSNSGEGSSVEGVQNLHSVYYNQFPEDPAFQELIKQTEDAIDSAIYPERIVQGSSGSYFVKNLDGVKVGVFKPKDEEPYGHLNPKWLKWMHRMCCPCCFGRSCLVPNQGYLSEAGASLVDQKLQLNVVPKTKVVRLNAPTFNYTPEQRAKARLKQRIVDKFPGAARKLDIHSELPQKTGSFQVGLCQKSNFPTFVTGYRDAEQWLRRWETQPDEAPPPVVKQDFQLQFERMVILDYIIRNTDRGNDNWLIRYDFPDHENKERSPGRGRAARGQSPRKGNADLIQIENDPNVPGSSNHNAAPTPVPKSSDEENGEISGEWDRVELPQVKVAAIDNGLAFPYKHPDEWRAYPYYWAWLPFAREPFSEETVNHVITQIDDTDFVADLCEDLRKMFRQDPGFDKGIVEDQLSVMRGQIFNLREALKSRKSPVQLVQMPPQLMVEVKTRKKRRSKHRNQSGRDAPASGETSSTAWHEKYRQKQETAANHSLGLRTSITPPAGYSAKMTAETDSKSAVVEKSGVETGAAGDQVTKQTDASVPKVVAKGKDEAVAEKSPRSPRTKGVEPGFKGC